MRRILTFALVAVFLIVLSACQTPEPIVIDRPAEVICPAQYMRIGMTCCLDADASNICDSDERAAVIPSETPVTPAKPSEPLPAAVPTINTIYEKAVNKIKNGYSYTVLEEQFYINGNKMKILPSDYINLGYDYDNSRLNLVDTVYMDMQTQGAFGVCSGRFFKTGVDKTCTRLTGMTFPLYYGDYYYKSPMDWLKEYQGQTEMYFRAMDKEIRGYYCDLIIFDDGSTLTSIWMDHTSGLPLRINVDRQKDKWSIGYYEYGKVLFFIDADEVTYQG